MTDATASPNPSTSSGGEVAIREHGTVTAIDAPSLDGTIAVDLDDGKPRVGVPEDTAVEFENTDTDDDTEVATDGGVVDRVGVSQHGVGLDREHSTYAVVAAAGAWMASGAMLSGGSGLAGVATFAGAVVLTGILAKQRKAVVA